MGMDKVSFQNGFIAGMATKGLTRSGNIYEPVCWNEGGVYTYFYINFRRAMSDFSTGMFAESVIVHDSEQLTVTAVEYVSAGIYKIYCDIANRNHGITVVNKATSFLSFADGTKLPVFSIHFFVTGIVSYERLHYCYDKAILEPLFETTQDNFSSSFCTWNDAGSYSDSGTLGDIILGTANETVSVVLT